MYLLIDGYNLLYAVGLLGRGIGPGGLERSRLALVGHLAASLEPEELAGTTIVFDAAGAPPGLPSMLHSRGLTILFAVGYEDADTLIEELIRSAPNPRRLVVVSSDRRLQRAARRRKASAVKSEAWYEDLSRRKRQTATQDSQAPPARPAVPLLAEEVAYWLGQFGGESIVDEVRRQERGREAAGAEPKAERPRPEGPPPDDPSGGKLTLDEAAEIADPFPPGYAEDLLEEDSGESDG